MPSHTQVAPLTLAQLVLRSPKGDSLSGALQVRHLHGHASRTEDLLDVGTARPDDIPVLGLTHLHRHCLAFAFLVGEI